MKDTRLGSQEFLASAPISFSRPLILSGVETCKHFSEKFSDDRLRLQQMPLQFEYEQAIRLSHWVDVTSFQDVLTYAF
jgi:hypothetical protein